MKPQEHAVLAADVGGTNTKVGLGRAEGSRVTMLARRVYPSQRHYSLEHVIDAFLGDEEVAAQTQMRPLSAACFAVAGPVEDGQARLTNLAWTISEAALASHLGLGAVRVINDFAAAGLGIPELDDTDFDTLQTGTPFTAAPRVVVGAGTGLGVALLIHLDGRYRVYASEAGHGDFAPGDAVQDALGQHLRKRFGHVSYERVLSGRGLTSIMEFLCESGGDVPGPELLEAMGEGDPAKAITRFALEERDLLAMRALDVFASAYGAFAGNMALATLAHGGVFIAGGIAPKIAAKLRDGTFIRAFCAKGRFRPLLETMCVKIVMNDHVGLYGALAEAGCAAAARSAEAPVRNGGNTK